MERRSILDRDIKVDQVTLTGFMRSYVKDCDDCLLYRVCLVKEYIVVDKLAIPYVSLMIKDNSGGYYLSYLCLTEDKERGYTVDRQPENVMYNLLSWIDSHDIKPDRVEELSERADRLWEKFIEETVKPW